MSFWILNAVGVKIGTKVIEVSKGIQIRTNSIRPLIPLCHRHNFAIKTNKQTYTFICCPPPRSAPKLFSRRCRLRWNRKKMVLWIVIYILKYILRDSQWFSGYLWFHFYTPILFYSLTHARACPRASVMDWLEFNSWVFSPISLFFPSASSKPLV